MEISVGGIAPQFKLPDQNGIVHQLRDYAGKWVLVYFYPRDNTPGCTKEACSIRDEFPHFGNLNTVVFGISIDSVESHKKFEAKYKLPFTLLSDENKITSEDYQAWGEKKFMGRKYMGLKTYFIFNRPSRQYC